MACWFHCWKNSTCFIWPVKWIKVLLMWKWISLILMKNHSVMSGLPFSSKLRWGSYSLSIAKAACYKIGYLVRQWSFFLLSLLIISINLLRNLAWNTIFMTRLVLLVTLWVFGMSYRHGNVGLLIIPLKPCLIV